MASNRRTQTQKPRNNGRDRDEYRRRLVAAATPRPSGMVYSRKGRNARNYGE